MNKPGTQVLDLPDHGVKTKHTDRGTLVFDPVRRKWLALTPEEWVRQHVINYLMVDLACPISILGVETPLQLNGLAKRADIVIFGNEGKPVAQQCGSVHVPLNKPLATIRFSRSGI